MCFVKNVTNWKSSSRHGRLWIFCCDVTYQAVSGSQGHNDWGMTFMAPKCRINKSLYILNICTIFLNLFVSESMNLSRRCMDSLIAMKDSYSHGIAIQSAILMLKLLVVTWGLARARPFHSFKNQKLWRLNKNIVLHAIKEHNNFGDNDQKCLI
jgi:hypothetical protein